MRSAEALNVSMRPVRVEHRDRVVAHAVEDQPKSLLLPPELELDGVLPSFTGRRSAGRSASWRRRSATSRAKSAVLRRELSVLASEPLDNSIRIVHRGEAAPSRRLDAIATPESSGHPASSH